MKTKYFLNWWIQKLNFAVLTKKYDTFDTIQKKVGDIKQIIVGSMNIDTLSVKSKLKTKTSRKWNIG
jgi:hypothetical protein